MKIVRNDEQGTMTFIPVEEDETKNISQIIEVVASGEILKYEGREDEEENDKFCVVYLRAGRIGLTLHGTTEDDKHGINEIRDMCYVGRTGGLIFLEKTEVDGVQSIVVTGGHCSVCSGNIIGFGRCEWGVCSSCVEKCDHIYKHGLIHGGGTDIGTGQFCQKCGRGKPKEPSEREKTQIEHHLAAEAMGFKIIYKGEGPVNPQEAVKFNRLLRRFKKSKKRAETSI